MKKSIGYSLSLIIILFLFTSCNQFKSDSPPPETVVDSFLQALQKQDYASIKSYYSENMDNMANFRNQIEEISPKVANELFNKLADFSYTIDNVTLDSTDSSKATVNTTILAYDLGPTFEQMVLDYIQSDIKMTFDGAKSEEIIKNAESLIITELQQATQTFSTPAIIHLSKEKDQWKLDKISENLPLLNALSGNIIFTLDTLSQQLP